MWRNLKLFEDNNCGDIFILLNNYLEYLILLNDEVRVKINDHIIKIKEINSLIEKGINIPIEDLNMNNKSSTDLLKRQKAIKFKIIEVNSVMNKYIMDYQKSSLKFFKRVLNFYIEKEDYESCRIIQNVIDLLS